MLQIRVVVYPGRRLLGPFVPFVTLPARTSGILSAMLRMPIFALVLYIATRLHLDGTMVDESMVALFGRVGLRLAGREIDADDIAGDSAIP